MAANFGAHETMEIHEVLTGTIVGINQFQLFRPQVRDGQLGQMLDHQLGFMLTEYDNLVGMLNRQGQREAIPYQAPRVSAQPVYGLDNPERQAPNFTAEQLDDRDIAAAMLFYHKSSAAKKMTAALEIADSQVRRAIQQSAVNCSEQAYEVWQYMNQKGYYQVPTMKETTTAAVLGTYSQSGQSSSSAGMGSGGAQAPQGGQGPAAGAGQAGGDGNAALPSGNDSTAFTQ